MGWLLLLLAYGLIWLSAAIVLGVQTPSPDWQSFYRTGRAVLDGTAWYATPAGAVPNLAPPLVALLFAALALLPIRFAFAIWTIAGLVAAFWSARRIAGVWRLTPWHVTAVLLAFHGTAIGVILGQLHLAVFVLVIAAWLADRDDRSLSAGAWLGAAIYLKPFLALVAVYWLWRRSWRAAGVAALVAGVANAAGLLWLSAATAAWIEALRSVTWQRSNLNLAVWALVERLHLPAWVAIALAALVLALLFWRLPALTRDGAWSSVLAAACLISPIAWVYYALPLVGPLGMLYQRGDRVTRRLIEVGYVGLCVPLAFGTPPPTADGFQAVTVGSWYLLAFVCWWLAGLRRSVTPHDPTRVMT